MAAVAQQMRRCKLVKTGFRGGGSAVHPSPPLDGPEEKQEEYECPLVGLGYNVTVHGWVAEVGVEQVFANSEENAVEAKYTFPMDGKATLVKVELKVGDNRTVKAVVQELDEARDTYDDGVAAGGVAAYIAKTAAGDAYEVLLGAVPRHATVAVSLAYITDLTPVVPSLDATDTSTEGRLTIPLTTMPLPNPQGSTGNKQPHVQAPYPIKVNVTGPGDAKISSPSHVGLEASENVLPDRDYVVAVVYPTAAAASCIQVAADEGLPAPWRHAIAVPVVPQVPRAVLAEAAKVGKCNTEVVCVLDCSGSMSGSPIAECERVAQYFLQSLPQGIRFNIVRFGRTHTALFAAGCMPMEEKTLACARKYIKGLRADMGGTDLYSPLEDILGQETVPGCSRQVVVVTDGAVSNTVGVLKLVKANAHEVRVFSVGIGACSRELVDGLAACGSGTAHYPQVGDSLTTTVMGITKQILQPCLTKCRIATTLPALTAAAAATSPIPPLFPGTKHVAYAFADDHFDPRCFKAPKPEDFVFESGTVACKLTDCGFIEVTDGTFSGCLHLDGVVTRKGRTTEVSLPIAGTTPKTKSVKLPAEGAVERLGTFLNRHGVRHDLFPSHEVATIHGYPVEVAVRCLKGELALTATTKPPGKMSQTVKLTAVGKELCRGVTLEDVSLISAMGNLGRLADAARVPHDYHAETDTGAVVNLRYSSPLGAHTLPCHGGGSVEGDLHRVVAAKSLARLEAEHLLGSDNASAIIALSKKFNIGSTQTAFVAVDDSVDAAASGPMLERVVPDRKRHEKKLLGRSSDTASKNAHAPPPGGAAPRAARGSFLSSCCASSPARHPAAKPAPKPKSAKKKAASVAKRLRCAVDYYYTDHQQQLSCPVKLDEPMVYECLRRDERARRDECVRRDERSWFDQFPIRCSEYEDDDVEELEAAGKDEGKEAADAADGLVFLQRIDGSWAPSQKVCSLLRQTKQPVTEVLLKTRAEDAGIDACVLTTALVMAYLTAFCSARKSEWELVYTKAEYFLNSHSASHLTRNHPSVSFFL